MKDAGGDGIKKKGEREALLEEGQGERTKKGRKKIFGV